MRQKTFQSAAIFCKSPSVMHSFRSCAIMAGAFLVVIRL